jgi:hypothetical protein
MSLDRHTPSRQLPARMRGQPLVVLALVLGGWSLLRAVTWVSPAVPAVADLLTADRTLPAAIPWTVPAATALPDQPAPRVMSPGSVPVPVPVAVAPWPLLRSPPVPGGMAPPPVVIPAATSQRIAAGHAMLMAAGFARMDLPLQLAAWFNARAPGTPAASAVERRTTLPAAPPVQAAAPGPGHRARRWTADGWLLWRDDTATPVSTGGPSYGRSQAGVVVRYNLVPAGSRRPQAYLRAAAALQGAREEEAALGLSARPLGGVPVRVAAELRASQGDRRFASGTRLRPAAYAVSELPVQHLPLGATAEAYAQAGYVGGEADTAFVDGQVRVDRSVVRHDAFDLRAGAGAWGGAQRGSTRLDVGPSAALIFRIGDARGRLAADYRFRVAGNAQPASGPALTLSAGF